MKKIITLALFIFLAACQKNVLFPSDNGKTLYLKLGDIFSIQLPENPSTGYQWHLIFNPENQAILSQRADRYAHSQTGLVGASGERNFSYQATGIGRVDIYATYARPWDESSSRQPSIQYTIVVQ